LFDFVLFVVVLAVLILGHEFGHFLAAKATGVKVEEFGLGFPPRLATLFHFRGTRFTLNAIPLGGFVRPAGEDDPDVPGGLASAPKRVRTLVLVAGPLANVLLAFLAFTAAYKYAAPDPSKVLVTTVEPGSPAATAGLQIDDLILTANGQTVDGFDALQAIVNDHLGQPISLTVDRHGTTVAASLVPRVNPPPNEGPIGITLGNPPKPEPLADAVRLGWDSTAAQIGMIVRLPARLVEGQIQPSQARVSGLKGMYDMLAWAGQIDRNTQRPFLTLNLIVVISIGLAIANLLPFPALDGGRLMFVAYEAVAGRRIAPRYEGLAHAIGFALLLIIMLYVNFQDFVNPISLPH
jgi:regulator of sigma E protease